MKPKALGLPVQYRLAVASRCLAALLGGYWLASMTSVLMALLAPLRQVDAALLGMMLSFVVYLLAFIWCFACRSARRAWVGVLAPGALLGLINALAYWMHVP
ncbi:DUF3649 domain-containing protein [Pseudomonas sp.]|uniref:DUF3649 domain-containing protein n=1 Tax=Pseudomonas sp. TaxID=306 RepID=UPI0028A87558|nr:DUF3649 domain-containing protein [Pseudomonas sp.]